MNKILFRRKFILIIFLSFEIIHYIFTECVALYIHFALAQKEIDFENLKK